MAVKAQDSVTVYDFNDIKKVRTWYKLVPRTSSAPTVAANATEAQMTSNGWTTTEPAVDTAKKLYTVQQNIFGDGSYVWGEVSLSSSYEAAIQAYNKASAAEGAANETAKYFWFNSTDSGAGEGAGAHITEKTKEAFIADPANGGGNVLIDNDSVDVRDGTNVLASFGEEAVIGKEGGYRTIISSDSMAISNQDGAEIFFVRANGAEKTLRVTNRSSGLRDYVRTSSTWLPDTVSLRLLFVPIGGVGGVGTPLTLKIGGDSGTFPDFTFTPTENGYTYTIPYTEGTYEVSGETIHAAIQGSAIYYAGSDGLALNYDFYVEDYYKKEYLGSGNYKYYYTPPATYVTHNKTTVIADSAVFGNFTVGDNLYLAGHNSPVGTFKSDVPSAVSCGTGKYYKVAQLDLTAGVWMVDCVGYFPATNGTGIRAIRVTTESFTNGTTTAPSAYGNITIDQRPAGNYNIFANSHFPVWIGENTTFRLVVWQNSGQTVSCNGRMYAVRIK